MQRSRVSIFPDLEIQTFERCFLNSQLDMRLGASVLRHHVVGVMAVDLLVLRLAQHGKRNAQHDGLSQISQENSISCTRIQKALIS